MYEDGNQTRDLCFVEDIARANLLAATTDKLDGLPVNVGSGRATSVRDLAGIIAEQLGVKIAPLARGEFRPGEIRSLISDISRIGTSVMSRRRRSKKASRGMSSGSRRRGR